MLTDNAAALEDLQKENAELKKEIGEVKQSLAELRSELQEIITREVFDIIKGLKRQNIL